MLTFAVLPSLHHTGRRGKWATELTIVSCQENSVCLGSSDGKRQQKPGDSLRLVRVGKLSQILYKVRSQIPQDCRSKLTTDTRLQPPPPHCTGIRSCFPRTAQKHWGVPHLTPYTVLNRTQAGAWHISLKSVPSYNGLSAVGSHCGQL